MGNPLAKHEGMGQPVGGRSKTYTAWPLGSILAFTPPLLCG